MNERLKQTTSEIPKQRRFWPLRRKIGRAASQLMENDIQPLITGLIISDPETFAQLDDTEYKAALIQYKAITLINKTQGHSHTIDQHKPKKTRVITQSSVATGIDMVTMRPVEDVTDRSRSIVRLVENIPGPDNTATDEFIHLTNDYDRDGKSMFNLSLDPQNLRNYSHEQLNNLYEVLNCIELAAIEAEGVALPL